ncbi:MAG: ribbon-helix-helix protein, CopG family [Ruminococcus sp.]|nr:ribbon-helix-helix protein, CopG family [Ruminococcus sp.]
MSEKLKIPKKNNIRGEDGYKVFSVRVKDSLVSGLDAISEQTNRSRNELINIMLDFAIKNCIITDIEDVDKNN